MLLKSFDTRTFCTKIYSTILKLGPTACNSTVFVWYKAEVDNFTQHLNSGQMVVEECAGVALKSVQQQL